MQLLKSWLLLPAAIMCCHEPKLPSKLWMLFKQRMFCLHKRQGTQVAKCDCCVQIYPTESLQVVVGQHQIQLVLASVQQAEAAAPKPKVGVHCHCSLFVQSIDLSHLTCHQNMLAVFWSCLTAVIGCSTMCMSVDTCLWTEDGLIMAGSACFRSKSS